MTVGIRRTDRWARCWRQEAIYPSLMLSTALSRRAREHQC